MKKEGRNQTITAGSLGLTSEVRSRNQYLIHRWEKCPVDIRLASRCNMSSQVDFKEESKVSNVKSRTERHFDFRSRSEADSLNCLNFLCKKTSAVEIHR